MPARSRPGDPAASRDADRDAPGMKNRQREITGFPESGRTEVERAHDAEHRARIDALLAESARLFGWKTLSGTRRPCCPRAPFLHHPLEVPQVPPGRAAAVEERVLARAPSSCGRSWNPRPWRSPCGTSRRRLRAIEAVSVLSTAKPWTRCIASCRVSRSSVPSSPRDTFIPGQAAAPPIRGTCSSSSGWPRMRASTSRRGTAVCGNCWDNWKTTRAARRPEGPSVPRSRKRPALAGRAVAHGRCQVRSAATRSSESRRIGWAAGVAGSATGAAGGAGKAPPRAASPTPRVCKPWMMTRSAAGW